MKKIAITGSYAVGKSNILKILKELGYYIFDADVYVRKLYEDKEFQNKIVEAIEGLDRFNKENLASILYANEQERKKIESIIHPLVIKEIKKIAEENKDKKHIFCEIPLLFEVGLTNEFDVSICIYCDEETRLKRAKEKNNFSQEKYEKLSDIQLSQEQKKKYADYLIDSGKAAEELEANIKEIIEQIKNG